MGVGAGIAAYKAALLVRLFRGYGWAVHVIPTPSSLHFVGEETWRELSENPVATGVFGLQGQGHVELARRADLVVVAPATADLLGRFRMGLADNLLTTTVLATHAPVLLAPAMHTEMWASAATQDNMETLLSRGFRSVGPGVGPLSSGDFGPGRMAEPEQIAQAAQQLLTERRQDESPQETGGALSGKRVLVSAGGTHEAIDPVRFIGNRSSGRQGIAIAQALRDRGAEVTLLAANVTVPLPPEESGLRVSRVTSALDLKAEIQKRLAEVDGLIMAAAVADFRPDGEQSGKIKKSGDSGLTLTLVQNPDILRSVATSAERPAVLVGFGAETGTPEQVLALGAAKAIRKGADLLAVNEVGHTVGFGDVDNRLFFFDAAGELLGEAEGSKADVAGVLADRVAELFGHQEDA